MESTLYYAVEFTWRPMDGAPIKLGIFYIRRIISVIGIGEPVGGSAHDNRNKSRALWSG